MTETAEAPPHAGMKSRAGWTLADSALSSLTNAGLTIGLARLVTDSEYGAFALAFTLFSLIQSLSMSVNNSVIVIEFAGSQGRTRHRALASAAAGSFVVGAGAGAVLVVVGLLLGGHGGLALVAMGAVMPALMLQDHWRLSFIAIGEPRRAFLLDLLWTVVWAALFVVLDLYGARTASVFIVVWGIGALLAAVWGQVWSGAGIDVRSVHRWFASHATITLPSVANTFATIGALQVAFVIISLLGSFEALGSLRGAQTLLGPLNIIAFAVTAFATPELVRRQLPARGLILSAVGLGGLLLAGTVVWGTFLLLLPDSVGRELLGDTWSGARETLPGLILFASCLSATAGAAAVMRSLNRVRSAAGLSIFLGIVVLVASSAGVALDGARGASYGFGLAGLVSLLPTAVILVRDARLGRRTDPPVGSD